MNNSVTKHDITKVITPVHSESIVQSNDINISYYENLPKIGEIPKTWPFVQILPFLQCAQSTEQFISAHSLSRAEQNSTNNLFIACMVVEILVMLGH